MSDSEGQQDQQPAPDPAPIAPVEPPGFHPDESMIDSSKRHEPWDAETRRLVEKPPPPGDE